MAKITLESSDGIEVEVLKDIAVMSGTIKSMLEDIDNSNVIPIPNVNGKTLTKILEYCQYHHEHQPSQKRCLECHPDTSHDVWDQEYVKMDQSALFDIIMAANYLDIKPLLELTCRCVADMIRGKTVEEIRALFNIRNDFTPEEEEQARMENEWIEEY